MVKPLMTNNDAFFITTHPVITKQMFSVCPESKSVKGAQCANDTGCAAGTVLKHGHGVLNGACSVRTGICNIKACVLWRVLPLLLGLIMAF